MTTASVESMIVPSMSNKKPSNATCCGGAVKDGLISAVVDPILFGVTVL